MDWLRPILLLAGAVFMALLVWWEGRQPRRVRGGEVVPAPRAEPSLGTGNEPAPERAAAAERAAAPERTAAAERAAAPAPGPAPGAERTASAVADQRGGATERGAMAERGPRRTLPAIDWSDVVPRAEPGPPLATDPVAASGASVRTEPTVAPEPPLVVEWPDEGARRIVTLRILPARHDRLAGRALRQGLTASGFRHGAFGIFHLPEQDGRVVISAASLVRPGMLDPATMDFQRFAGINLFAVLPGPLSDEQALQRLGHVAVELATRVEGQVQEESGAPFDAAAVAAWRARCLAAIEGSRPALGPAH